MMPEQIGELTFDTRRLLVRESRELVEKAYRELRLKIATQILAGLVQNHQYSDDGMVCYSLTLADKLMSKNATIPVPAAEKPETP